MDNILTNMASKYLGEPYISQTMLTYTTNLVTFTTVPLILTFVLETLKDNSLTHKGILYQEKNIIDKVQFS